MSISKSSDSKYLSLWLLVSVSFVARPIRKEWLKEVLQMKKKKIFKHQNGRAVRVELGK